MNRMKTLTIVLVALVVVGAAAVPPATAQTQQPPKVQMPQPGVPEIMTMEGKFVRAAYNNEGYVILGYQAGQPVDRRGVDAPRGRHDGARQDAGLQADPRRDLARDARRQDDSPADGRGAPGGEHPGPAESGEGPARLDQLLSAERDTRVPRWRSSPIWTRARCPRTRSSSATPAPASAGSTSRCRAASSTASTG